MNLIQEELALAKEKMLSVIPDTNLVELSQDNVAIIEAMIQNDSDYLKSSEKEAGPTGKYGGSTAYWMTQLKFQLFKQSESNEEYRKVLEGAIAAVDRENSTHLNSDGIGRGEIAGRLLEICKEELITYLKEPVNTDFWLIRRISDETHPTGTSKRGNPYRPRENISFASKFCHYACFYIFEGEAEQDNYSIYDNVLKKVLPKYIEHYRIQKRNLNDYLEYQLAVDDLIATSNANISRNGFDHLLWYYYKGRI